MLVAQLTRQNDRILLKIEQYNMMLVGVLNRKIPEDARRWHSGGECTISLAYENVILSALKRFSYIYFWTDAPHQVAENETYSVLGLLSSAPLEVCEAAYRALCKLHHPDIGGDTDKMSKINQAYEKICLQRSKKTG